MACNCNVCKHLAEFQTRLSAVPEEHQGFFKDLMDLYLNASMDLDVNKAILDGSWGSAKMYIEHAANKLGYTLTPLDK